MATLRFHRTLYSEAAIREAMEVYSAYAELELTEQEPYALVQVASTSDGLDHDLLAGELANHALARSIEERRSQ